MKALHNLAPVLYVLALICMAGFVAFGFAVAVLERGVW
jgi:hypothetical protein